MHYIVYLCIQCLSCSATIAYIERNEIRYFPRVVERSRGDRISRYESRTLRKQGAWTPRSRPPEVAAIVLMARPRKQTRTPIATCSVAWKIREASLPWRRLRLSHKPRLVLVTWRGWTKISKRSISRSLARDRYSVIKLVSLCTRINHDEDLDVYFFFLFGWTLTQDLWSALVFIVVNKHFSLARELFLSTRFIFAVETKKKSRSNCRTSVVRSSVSRRRDPEYIRARGVFEELIC